MIALPDDLPLVEFEGGQQVLFQRDWLIRSLLQAAEKAGYQKWWLAEHVAESISSYLQLRYDQTVVASTQLARAVQSALQVIGYAEVANHYVPGPPPIKISLLELARAAGTGYELAFFELLGRRIQELMQARSNHFELYALERCVKLLRSRKVWSRDCDALGKEIVSYVREQIEASRPAQDVAFSVSSR